MYNGYNSYNYTNKNGRIPYPHYPSNTPIQMPSPPYLQAPYPQHVIPQNTNACYQYPYNAPIHVPTTPYNAQYTAAIQAPQIQYGLGARPHPIHHELENRILCLENKLLNQMLNNRNNAIYQSNNHNSLNNSLNNTYITKKDSLSMNLWHFIKTNKDRIKEKLGNLSDDILFNIIKTQQKQVGWKGIKALYKRETTDKADKDKEEKEDKQEKEGARCHGRHGVGKRSYDLRIGNIGIGRRQSFKAGMCQTKRRERKRKIYEDIQMDDYDGDHEFEDQDETSGER